MYANLNFYRCRSGIASFVLIPSEENVADTLTKPLGRERFEKMRKVMMYIEPFRGFSVIVLFYDSKGVIAIGVNCDRQVFFLSDSFFILDH
jgi:hypothetical protein